MTTDIAFDAQHIWHPYTSMTNPIPAYPVKSATGTKIRLETGEELVDGMSSWWSVIHGYNNKTINEAISTQLGNMSHVMFGGLTHEPAVELCRKLIAMTPSNLDRVFLSDSGSVAVEVALKMAIQYWHSKRKTNKTQMVALNKGYHGDTFGAMSICDPVTGMHQLFSGFMAKNHFVPSPSIKYFDSYTNDNETINALETLLKEKSHQIAAFVIEPIVQGAGGMNIYHPDYLRAIQDLCHKYNVLFIADEIATGFGRTGKLFACEHANIQPDILCLGKAITGGYMTLAATLTTSHVAEVISQGEAGVFMHGPTFMGNPLACAAANASLDILATQKWRSQVNAVETWLDKHFTPLRKFKRVNDVRILGAIGVVEVDSNVDMVTIQKEFVQNGVWIRPFGKLIYVMPPYISSEHDIQLLAQAIISALNNDKCFSE